MALTVVNVGYPLAAVSPDSAGGAEQILCSLDRALVARGHRSIVIAPVGSQVAGALRPIPGRSGVLDEAAKTGAQADARQAIATALREERVDVVHLHGIDFAAYLPPPGVPVLATLHLPPDWYPRDALNPTRPDTWLNCVSEAQHARCPPSPALLPPIANGIDLDSFRGHHFKRNFALFLGRICPEKGVHLAIEAARRAGVPLLIAGQVYGYTAHREYFDSMIRPYLGRMCRFLGPIGLARKRRLLGAAGCVLVPSLAAETSSLVAREAAAAGTPVIAFPNGAMVDTVEHGRTGFLVDDIDAMVRAIIGRGAIAPEVCRALAASRFSDRPMIESYLALYAYLAASRVRHAG